MSNPLTHVLLLGACSGVENLLEDEAVVVGGSNHSHATQDLYDAIAAGDYPEWKLLIQVRLLSMACNSTSLDERQAGWLSACVQQPTFIGMLAV